MPSPSFTRTTWVNDSEPDITAEQLNRAEGGIEDAHERLDVHDTTLGAHATRLTTLEGGAPGGSGALDWVNAATEGAVGNDATDNTGVLQAILDDFRDNGGGVLYLPGGPETIYRTNALWIPSNTKILGRGCGIRLTGKSAAARHDTGEPEAIYATSLYAAPQTQNIGAGTTFTDPHDITLEGFTLYPHIGGTKDVNGVPTGALAGIAFSGVHYGTIRDVTVEYGSSEEAIQIGARAARFSEHILVEDVRVPSGGRRNGASVDSCRFVVFRRVLIEGTTQDSPSDAFPPGYGIDVEPPNIAGGVEYLRFEDCVIRSNAKAGLGLNLSANALVSPVKDIVVERCIIDNNGDSGILFAGGAASGHTPWVCRVIGNRVIGNNGNSVGGSTNAALILQQNDLRPTGAFSAVGVTGYDAGRSTIGPNILS